MTRRSRALVAVVVLAPSLLLTAAGCQHDESLRIENVVLVRAGTPTTRDLQFGQSPWIVPSGTAGQLRLYFVTGFGTPTNCTLTLDGQRQLKPLQISPEDGLRFMIEYPTAALKANQVSTASLVCPYRQASFGETPPTTAFTVSAAPILRPTVTPRTVWAPTTQVGASSEFAVTVGNAFGGRPFTVESVSFTDAGGPDYRVMASSCDDRVVRAEEMCTLTVRFAPAVAGTSRASARLFVVSSDDLAVASDVVAFTVEGQGTAPQVQPEEQPHHPPAG